MFSRLLLDRKHADLKLLQACAQQRVSHGSPFLPVDVNTANYVATLKALDAIAAVSPITEIGCGTGYWAALLRTRGVDVLAFDMYGALPYP